MSTKTYFIGTGLDSLEPENLTPTDTGTAVGINGSNDSRARGWFIDPDTQQRTSLSAFWAHITTNTTQNTNSTIAPIFFRNTSGDVTLRLRGTGSASTYNFQYWDGSAFQDVGSNFTLGGEVPLDFYFDIPGGTIRMWHNGAQVFDVSGLSLGSVGNIDRIGVGRYRSWNENYSYRGIIIASYNTVGHTVRRRTPTGAGAHTAWAGTFADIDDTGINDADNITSTTPGEKETFTASALSATPGGSVIKAVGIAARCRNDGGSSPQNFRAMMRIGGTDYPANGNAVIGIGYQGSISIFENDPSISGPWASITNVNAEFGVESQA